MVTNEGSNTANPQPERELAARLFNRVWELLAAADRSPDTEAAMVHTAHASCFHWLQVGEPVNAARGEWQCSRVYAVLGRAEPARYHARRSLDICRRAGIGDFDLAFAYEALARAAAVAGDDPEAERRAGQARAASAQIAAAEDREVVLSDLDNLPLAAAPPPRRTHGDGGAETSAAAVGRVGRRTTTQV